MLIPTTGLDQLRLHGYLLLLLLPLLLLRQQLEPFFHSSNPIHRYGCLAMTIHCVGQVYLDPTESADMTIRPLHKFCTKAHTINTFIITNIIRVPLPLDLDPDRRIIISLPLLLDPSRAELGPCISAQIQSPRRQQLAHEATFNLLPQEAEEHPLPSPLQPH